MPEGPEIKRAADAVAKAIEGQRLCQPELNYETVSKFATSWDGLLVKRVRARGKALLILLESDQVLYTHNQLYGRWYIRNRGDYPKTNRQLRLGLHTEKKSALLYSATDIEVLARSELEKHSYISKLGPDILGPNTDTKTVQKRLLDQDCRNRQLASLYLDQSFLAGPGNYLRCEILFLSGLAPDLSPGQLSSKQRRKLAETTLATAQRAYQTKGTTTPSELASSLKAEGRPRRDWRFFVYNRAGRPCHRCGRDIKTSNAGGRKLFFCPCCQMA